MYIARLTQEVGNKLRAKSAFDIPRFQYKYGYSFVLACLSFGLTELTGVLCVYLFITLYKEKLKKDKQRRITHTNAISSSENQHLNRRPPHGHVIQDYHMHTPRCPSRSREPQTRSRESSPVENFVGHHSRSHTPVSDNVSRELSTYNIPRDGSHNTMSTTVDITREHQYEMMRKQTPV